MAQRYAPALGALAILALFAALMACSGEDSADATGTTGTNALEEASEFTRYVKHSAKHASLETAIATYEDADGRRVDLAAVVHVGDRPYYDLYNQVFRAYDAVLYEMIKAKDVEPGALKDNNSLISKLQRGIKSLLGLDFQLDVIDYTPSNFIHADLDPAGFIAQQAEAGESLWGMFFSSMLKGFSLDDDEKKKQSAQTYAIGLALFSSDRAYAMKKIMAQQFGELETMLATLGAKDSEKGSVILHGRNTHVLKVLRESLDEGKKKVVIFFGAAHMPDLEERLVSEFGFHKTGEQWLTAWDIKPTKKKQSKPE